MTDTIKSVLLLFMFMPSFAPVFPSPDTEEQGFVNDEKSLTKSIPGNVDIEVWEPIEKDEDGPDTEKGWEKEEKVKRKGKLQTGKKGRGGGRLKKLEVVQERIKLRNVCAVFVTKFKKLSEGSRIGGSGGKRSRGEDYRNYIESLRNIFSRRGKREEAFVEADATQDAALECVRNVLKEEQKKIGRGEKIFRLLLPKESRVPEELAREMEGEAIRKGVSFALRVIGEGKGAAATFSAIRWWVTSGGRSEIEKIVRSYGETEKSAMVYDEVLRRLDFILLSIIILLFEHAKKSAKGMAGWILAEAKKEIVLQMTPLWYPKWRLEKEVKRVQPGDSTFVRSLQQIAESKDGEGEVYPEDFVEVFRRNSVRGEEADISRVEVRLPPGEGAFADFIERGKDSEKEWKWRVREIMRLSDPMRVFSVSQYAKFRIQQRGKVMMGGGRSGTISFGGEESWDGKEEGNKFVVKHEIRGETSRSVIDPEKPAIYTDEYYLLARFGSEEKLGEKTVVPSPVVMLLLPPAAVGEDLVSGNVKLPIGAMSFVLYGYADKLRLWTTMAENKIAELGGLTSEIAGVLRVVAKEAGVNRRFGGGNDGGDVLPVAFYFELFFPYFAVAVSKELLTLVSREARRQERRVEWLNILNAEKTLEAARVVMRRVISAAEWESFKEFVGEKEANKLLAMMAVATGVMSWMMVFETVALLFPELLWTLLKYKEGKFEREIIYRDLSCSALTREGLLGKTWFGRGGRKYDAPRTELKKAVETLDIEERNILGWSSKFLRKWKIREVLKRKFAPGDEITAMLRFWPEALMRSVGMLGESQIGLARLEYELLNVGEGGTRYLLSSFLIWLLAASNFVSRVYTTVPLTDESAKTVLTWGRLALEKVVF